MLSDTKRHYTQADNLFLVQEKFKRFKTNFDEKISRTELQNILDELAPAGRFDQEVASELFEQIEISKQMPLTINNLIELLVEAENILFLKKSYIQEVLVQKEKEMEYLMKKLHNIDRLKLVQSSTSSQKKSSNTIILEIHSAERLGILLPKNQDDICNCYLSVKMGARSMKSDPTLDNDPHWGASFEMDFEDVDEDILITIVKTPKIPLGYINLSLLRLNFLSRTNNLSFFIKKKGQDTLAKINLSITLNLPKVEKIKEQIEKKIMDLGTEIIGCKEEIQIFDEQIDTLQAPFANKQTVENSLENIDAASKMANKKENIGNTSNQESLNVSEFESKEFSMQIKRLKEGALANASSDQQSLLKASSKRIKQINSKNEVDREIADDDLMFDDEYLKKALKIGESRLDKLKSISEISQEENRLDNKDFDLSKISASKVCNRSMQTSQKLHENNLQSTQKQYKDSFEDYPQTLYETKHVRGVSSPNRNMAPLGSPPVNIEGKKATPSTVAKDFLQVDSFEIEQKDASVQNQDGGMDLGKILIHNDYHKDNIGQLKTSSTLLQKELRIHEKLLVRTDWICIVIICFGIINCFKRADFISLSISTYIFSNIHRGNFYTKNKKVLSFALGMSFFSLFFDLFWLVMFTKYWSKQVIVEDGGEEFIMRGLSLGCSYLIFILKFPLLISLYYHTHPFYNTAFHEMVFNNKF